MSKKVKTYENTFIGQFLLTLGYYLRDRDYSLPTSVNLYQQTRADYTVGDLFSSLGGQYFIIEFKTRRELTYTERKKPQRLKLFQLLKDEAKHLVKLSVKGHLLSYPENTEQGFDYHIKPYIWETTETKPEYCAHGIREFISKVIDTKTMGVSFEEIQAYLTLLRSCAVSTKSGSSSFSGILMSFSEEGVKYVEIDDLNILEQQLRLAHEVKQTITREINRSKGRDNGLSM